MAKNADKIEELIKKLECKGERVTKEVIESRIVEVDYKTIVIAGQKLMYCGIKMDTGFVVVGSPATCLTPSNWRDEIARTISYDNTFSDIWKLEAYRKASGA